MRWLCIAALTLGCAGGTTDIDAVPLDGSVRDTQGDSSADSTAVGDSALVDTASPIDAGDAGGCNPAMDPCPAAQHCDTATKKCVDGCKSDAGCTAPSRCDIVSHTCVACVTDVHCPDGKKCVGKVCVDGCDAAKPCPLGLSCCVGSCIDTKTNVDHCGMCGDTCTVINGTGKCVDGACRVSSCKDGWGDCDKDGKSCEASTTIELANCGGCGLSCTLADSVSACLGGKCSVSSCTAGYGDCDKDPKTGCEINLKNDPANCGACGKAPAETCNLADDNCNGKCDDVSGCRTGVYRTYKASTGEHFYTTSATEGPGAGFVVEFPNYYYLYSASAPGLVSFYRCWVPGVSMHFYTADPACEGQTVEGPMGFIATSAVCGAVPLYRLAKSNGDHLYTTSASERDSMVTSSGYVYESIAGYVWTGDSG